MVNTCKTPKMMSTHLGNRPRFPTVALQPWWSPQFSPKTPVKCCMHAVVLLHLFRHFFSMYMFTVALVSKQLKPVWFSSRASDDAESGIFRILSIPERTKILIKPVLLNLYLKKEKWEKQSCVEPNMTKKLHMQMTHADPSLPTQCMNKEWSLRGE